MLTTKTRHFPAVSKKRLSDNSPTAEGSPSISMIVVTGGGAQTAIPDINKFNRFPKWKDILAARLTSARLLCHTSHTQLWSPHVSRLR